MMTVVLEMRYIIETSYSQLFFRADRRSNNSFVYVRNRTNAWGGINYSVSIGRSVKQEAFLEAMNGEKAL